MTHGLPFEEEEPGVFSIGAFGETLAPGVVGYTSTDKDGTLLVPVISAITPGQGDVSRYLDSLPKDRRVAFPTVMSSILAGALARRGFWYTDRLAYSEQFGEWVTGWVREAERSA